MNIQAGSSYIHNPVPNPPVVAQPARSMGPQEVGFMRGYVFSFVGLLRFGLIIFQFAGWVSAAAVPKFFSGYSFLPPELSASRDAYLFFSITGFLIAIVLFVIYAFNIKSQKPFNRLPIELFIIATDILWGIPTFVLAIVAAVREGSVRDPLFLYQYYINVGAFGAASFFGFVCALLYGIDAGFYLMKTIRGNPSS